MGTDRGQHIDYWGKVIPADPKSFLVEVEHCYGCSGTTLEALSPVEPAGLLRCPACGLVFTSPRLSDDTLTMIYTDNPGELTRESEEALDDYMKQRYLTMRREMFTIDDSDASSMLDVGCGWGHFLKHAKRDFSEVVGVELSNNQSQWARETLGIPVERINILEERLDRKFSVICLFEVIEHVTNPRGVIEWCFAHLEPGGQLALSTPNFDSVYRRLLGSRWWYFIPTQHLTYFTARSLRYLLSRSGFRRMKAVTSGRSLLNERRNNHNQIDAAADLRSQWLQSLEIRSQIELERNPAKESKGLLPRLGNHMSWRISLVASVLGFGDQLRLYAVKD
jgi:SAM-dependent methyltransferase